MNNNTQIKSFARAISDNIHKRAIYRFDSIRSLDINNIETEGGNVNFPDEFYKMIHCLTESEVNESITKLQKEISNIILNFSDIFPGREDAYSVKKFLVSTKDKYCISFFCKYTHFNKSIGITTNIYKDYLTTESEIDMDMGDENFVFFERFEK